MITTSRLGRIETYEVEVEPPPPRPSHGRGEFLPQKNGSEEKESRTDMLICAQSGRLCQIPFSASASSLTVKKACLPGAALSLVPNCDDSGVVMPVQRTAPSHRSGGEARAPPEPEPGGLHHTSTQGWEKHGGIFPDPCQQVLVCCPNPLRTKDDGDCAPVQSNWTSIVLSTQLCTWDRTWSEMITPKEKKRFFPKDHI